MDFSRIFVFPVPSLLKRPVKLDGAWTGTIICAAAAIPTFFRVQNNWRFSLFRMRYIYIDRAYFYTDIAPVTNIRIE